MGGYSAFSYKAGNSFVHGMKAWKKILFIPAFNILVFSLDLRVAAVFILLQFVLFFCLKFTVREQFADLVPVVWYGIFLYMLGIAGIFFSTLNMADGEGCLEVLRHAVRVTMSDRKTHSLVLKFFACNQSASLMFKTSTSLQLKEGIEGIELAVRRFLPVKKEPSFSMVISMFINFIPAVFKMWNQLKRAWLARNGRNSVRMYFVLFPVLFSVGLKYASDTARAILNRSRGA